MNRVSLPTLAFERSPKWMRIKKVAIVTGGSYGIGKACAAVFAESGMDIAILSRKRKEGLETREEICKFGTKVIHIETDVSDKEQVRRSVAQVSDEFRRIDILVNNAGIVTPVKFFLNRRMKIGTA